MKRARACACVCVYVCACVRVCLRTHCWIAYDSEWNSRQCTQSRKNDEFNLSYQLLRKKNIGFLIRHNDGICSSREKRLKSTERIRKKKKIRPHRVKKKIIVDFQRNRNEKWLTNKLISEREVSKWLYI